MPYPSPSLRDQIPIGKGPEEGRPVLWCLVVHEDCQEGSELVGRIDEGEGFELVQPGEGDLLPEGEGKEEASGLSRDIRE
ncbi:hypothetical protein HYFRA_00001759 [Hymenoscyphus fraxineus]|uniref:Uncharacterized protein n=1 Tax=Hymenoscyphus fraxineus TaxID=746836 RepID=A0A9N9L8W2_9HELO|nr:hypothetical protein HYFRA_00001759 [Hymenoscyphus fraxineus]